MAGGGLLIATGAIHLDLHLTGYSVTSKGDSWNPAGTTETLNGNSR
jgi:hypothetical protein